MAIAANSQGVVAGKFNIPTGVPPGAKLVEFIGAASKAAATFVGRGTITVRELQTVRRVTTITTRTFERYDPVAQTFTLDAAAQISGVELWFCVKGTGGRTFVEIREVENGVPTQEVVASAVKLTSALTTGGWHRFSWPAPCRLQAGREYAIVVGCDDATTSVMVAELGKFDAAAQQWVTQQPYQVGVMLSSSNASTWTPHQDKDLAFKLLRTPNAATTLTVPLPSVAVTNCDEVMVMAAVERPTERTDCVFRLTLPDATVLTVGEGERLLLPSTVTGTIQMAAILTGTADATPTLSPDVQLVWGTRSASATYISRALPAGTGSKVSVYFESLLPGTAGVTIDVAQDGNGTGGWTSIPFLSGTQIGDGWEDRTYRLNTFNPTTAVVRITLTGNARNRPMLRKLRVVVT